MRESQAEAVADSLAAHDLGLPQHTRWEALVGWARLGRIPRFTDPPVFLGWCVQAVYDHREECVWCERITRRKWRPVWRR